MPKEWQFIATATDGKAKEGDATLVRKTAMRAFRRNERLGRIGKLRAEVVLERAGDHNQETRPNNQLMAPFSAMSQSAGAETALEFRWRTTLVDIGPAVAFDPFVSTTLHSNREHIEHFIHCKSGQETKYPVTADASSYLYNCSQYTTTRKRRYQKSLRHSVRTKCTS